MASTPIQPGKLGTLFRKKVSGEKHLAGSFYPSQSPLKGAFSEKFIPLIEKQLRGLKIACGSIDPNRDSDEAGIASRLDIDFSSGEAFVIGVAGVGIFGFSGCPEVSREITRTAAHFFEGEAPSAVVDKHPSRCGPLEGMIAFITGGASGIGLATAHRLLKEGACVTIGDINQTRLEQEAASLGEMYGPDRIHAVICDVTSSESVKSAFCRITKHWCGLDILVNNAGTALSGSLFDLTEEDYDRQNAIMPRGSFLCTREAAGIFHDQGMGGDIVYIASKNSVFAGSKNLAYSTAKAAQLHQARLAAVELSEIRVRVNVVNPDAVVQGSSIFSGGWAADRAKAYGIEEENLGQYYAQRNLLKTELLPEDIAAAVYVLVGPDLRKSTGLVINVDGGFAPSMLR